MYSKPHDRNKKIGAFFSESKYQNKLHRERERERERESAFCGCWKNGEGIMHQDLKRHSDDASLEQEYYYWEKRRLEM